MTASGPKIALAQLNGTVGDLEGNASRVKEAAHEAVSAGASLVVFPELFLPGYPAEDLYLRTDFVEAGARTLGELAADLDGATFLVGFAEPSGPAAPGRPIASNSVAAIADRKIVATYRKRLLPNYGVFDERRTFRAGSEPCVVGVDDWPVGLSICEDCWDPEDPVVADLAPGARLLANLSASPFHRGKGEERERIFRDTARRLGVPVVMTNAVGGQDELVFDGASAVFDSEGQPLARASRFDEELLVFDWEEEVSAGPLEEGLADVYQALVTGIRDYVGKNGFDRVGLGLSGGIDSALVAVLAVDALGPDRVSCVVMPSPHSSEETQSDARELGRALGCETLEYPIGELMAGYRDLLGPDDQGLASENIQARIRGNLLMALSNSRGWLILTTSNKSEASVGYATLYGDMAGGFAPIKDVAKGLVYELCEYRNRDSGPIPRGIMTRPPSAELRPGQLDVDSLPDYDELDEILRLYIEEDLGPDQITSRGFDRATAERVVGLVDRAEYKRRQSAPGIRITARALGRDRRMPVTNRYRPESA